MLKKTIGNGAKSAFTLAEGATHVEMFGKARKSAFTLAEVLITLGIIGVVAAMTMPTLINSTQGAQYKTAYKKALSVMSQAVVMNIALEDYDLSQTVVGIKQGEEAASEAQTLFSLFRNRMNVVKVADGSDFNTTDGDPDCWKIVSKGDDGDYTKFAEKHDGSFPELTGGDGGTVSIKWPDATTVLFFNDGISFIFDNKQGNCQLGTATNNLSDHYCFGFIDVNGQKAPNRVVMCDTSTLSETDKGKDDANCTVTNPTDIYPIAMFDQSIIPASAAARAVLYAK